MRMVMGNVLSSSIANAPNLKESWRLYFGPNDIVSGQCQSGSTLHGLLRRRPEPTGTPDTQCPGTGSGGQRDIARCPRRLPDPAADRCDKARLASVAAGRGQWNAGDVGHGLLGVDVRQQNSWRQGGQKEVIDIGHAYLDRVRHAGPISIAQELVAHVECGLEDGDPIETIEPASAA